LNSEFIKLSLQKTSKIKQQKNTTVVKTYNMSISPEEIISRPVLMLKKIDEQKLIEMFPHLTDDQIKNLARRRQNPLKKTKFVNPVKKSLPSKLTNLIVRLKLLDEIPSQRYNLLIGHCRNQKMKLNTVKTYIYYLEQVGVLDPNFKREPNLQTFKPARLMLITQEDYSKMIKYCLTRPSLTLAPILLAIFTGLRTREILQCTSYTLYELKNRKSPVQINRKQTVLQVEPTLWRPVYSQQLNSVIDILIYLFKEKYELYMENKIILPLFPFNAVTIVRRVHALYNKVVGKVAPSGLGIHSFRYLLASAMNIYTNNLASIQDILQHRKIETTKQYIHHDLNQMSKRIDQLLAPNFTPLIDALNQLL
jgi:integrase